MYTMFVEIYIYIYIYVFNYLFIYAFMHIFTHGCIRYIILFIRPIPTSPPFVGIVSGRGRRSDQRSRSTPVAEAAIPLNID